MTSDAIIAVIVFTVVYGLIAFEWLNKAIAALLGVMILLILGVIDDRAAARYIDFETIMLLIGMMGIVAVLKRSGFFNILTVHLAGLTKGRPLSILILFGGATALLSAFLDNVTTVLVMVPIVIELTRGMGLNPRIYVIAVAMASNLGGTATLIGDPPNIIIGSEVGLTFNQFLIYLSLPVALCTVAVMAWFRLSNRDHFRSIEDNLTRLFTVDLLLGKTVHDFKAVPIDRRFLIKSLVCLIVVLLLFVTQSFTRLSPGVAALTVALVLFVINRMEIETILLEIEWSTLLFFAGLFVLVGTLEEKGVIEWLARTVFLSAGSNPYVMVLLVLWVSGLASGVIDNIPFTITMIPIVKMMLADQPVPHGLLWWALSLGACLGGNLTLIGASANIVAVGVMKKYGEDISFWEYTRRSAPGALLSLVICSFVLVGYLWVLG
jgi:Na+/H+ antiporter NhaD/arsenite permease-like protein